MRKPASRKSVTTAEKVDDSLKLKRKGVESEESEHLVHKLREGVRCDTEKRGHATPDGRPITEIVVDASEGFVPLWKQNTTLRWTFRQASLQLFAKPAAAAKAIENLLGEAILAWGDAAPVKFTHRDDAWDFEIVVRQADDCDVNGCVLASAFFPDAGRHTLTIYPKLFSQSHKEQVETLVHEIGHIFGLRHFFALVSETKWPAQIFGKHSKFTIMNYGANSTLTDDDRADLKALYQAAWSKQLTQVNGTPIKFVQAFHETGSAATSDALIFAQPVPV